MTREFNTSVHTMKPVTVRLIADPVAGLEG